MWSTIIGLINWRYLIAGGVVITAIGGGYLHYTAKVAKLEAEVAQAQIDLNNAVAAAKANLDSLNQVRAAYATSLDLQRKSRIASEQRNRDLQSILEDMRNAAPAECPAGDRLVTVHDGLRRLIEARSGHPDSGGVDEGAR